MRQGGSYRTDDSGKPKLVERTEEHPQGNRARDAEGNPLPVHPPAPPAATKAPAAKAAKE